MSSVVSSNDPVCSNIEAKGSLKLALVLVLQIVARARGPGTEVARALDGSFVICQVSYVKCGVK